MKKILILLLFVNISVHSQSFLYKLGLELGYKYKYNKNASVGLSYKLKQERRFIIFTNWENINITYLTNFNNENYIVAGITGCSTFFETGLNVSTKLDIEPIVGFNIGNRARINFGYNFAYKQKNNFTFGISFAIGIKKKRELFFHKKSLYYVDYHSW